MRILPEKYSNIEKSLPVLVALKQPVTAIYTSPTTKQEKQVKVAKDTSFSISAIPNKIYAEGEEVFVNSDLVVVKGVTAGKSGRVYGKFKYSDLVNNAVIVDRGYKRYKPATKSLLIFGVPRKIFFVGLGAVMVIAGVYYLKKKK